MIIYKVSIRKKILKKSKKKFASEGEYLPYIGVGLSNEGRFYNGELFCTMSFTYMKKLEPQTLELTLEEVAKKFGVDVNNLKIKK